MKKSPTINKNRELSKSQDFHFLRKVAIQRIEELGSELWTDYNIHDPGITILETLCYAITELGYRTGFDIQDILARDINDNTKDFFSAGEILTCNPVTIIDFRKLIIDQVGIQNGWLHVTKESPADSSFNYRCNDTDHAYEVRVNDTAGFDKKFLNGLYNVSLQLDEDDQLGDLNSNIIDWQIANADADLIDVKLVIPVIEIAFPTWDYPIAKLFDYHLVTQSSLINFQNIAGQISFDLILEFDSDPTKIINIEGIDLLVNNKNGLSLQQADLVIEFEKNNALSFSQTYCKRLKKILSLIKNIYCALHSHRNLCEDYVKFSIVRSQEISLCANIELTPDADPEEVLAHILFEVDRFLAPPVDFYSLKEMIDKKLAIETIFEGIVPEHGFIDQRELEKSELKTEIHTSDLYRIIMTLPQVRAIKGLMITNYLDGIPQTTGEKWCIKLGAPYHLNLRTDDSKILFNKDGLPFRADRLQIERLIQIFKAEHSRPKLQLNQRDLPIPSGQAKALAEYYSIQNDFPLTYGIGKDGLPSTTSHERKSQAKQLKAFLMFFDQLLANYLAQLADAKNQLSVSANVSASYAINPLYKPSQSNDRDDFPMVENLFKDFIDTLDGSEDLDDLKSLQTKWNIFTDNNNNYIKNLKSLTESRKEFQIHRNQFLDHLLARFAESFSDYALLIHRTSEESSGLELIKDKQKFLTEYPKISSERGKAFQLKCYDADISDPWQANNISGLRHRLSRLLGIDNIKRYPLGYKLNDVMNLFSITGAGPYEFQLNMDGKTLLNSANSYTTEEDTIEAIYLLINHAANRDNFKIRPAENYSFDLFDPLGELLASHPDSYDDSATALEIIIQIVTLIKDNFFREGMHLFEHILLRPMFDRNISENDVNEGYFPSCKLTDDCSCPIDDHYSFRITLVFPYWPERFRNMDFRHYVERMVHLETPAHILAKICWVDITDMNALEDCYLAWLEEVSKITPKRNLLDQRSEALIKKMNTLTNIYPEGVLHDCTEPVDDDAIILNRSTLGTFEDIENELTD